jgi:AsmA protein
MNKKLKWLAVGVTALSMLAAMAQWTFSGSAMRSELALQVRETTGLIAEASGRTTLAILPRPRIKIDEVTIRDRDGKLLIKSGTLRGNLRILPAFAGRMEVSSLSLTAPDIDIDLDGKPLSGGGAIARAIDARPETREAASADKTRLASLTIHNGTARLTRGGNIVSKLENIEATLDWRSLDTPAGLRASFNWAQEPVEITAWLGQPAKVLRGDSSPVSLRLDSPSLALSANGIATGGPTPSYAGKFTANAPSLRTTLAGNSIYLPLPGKLGALALSADARASLRSIQLSDLQFNLDETAYEGAVILTSHQGRPALMGTLATRFLAIEPLLAQAPAVRQSDGRWSGAPLPQPDLARADVDLRISANRAQIGRTEVRDAGFSILVAGGKAEVSIAEAKVFGGAIKARLGAEPSGGGYQLSASGAFTKLDSAAVVGEIFRSQRLSGEATGEFALAGAGVNMAQVLSSLRGTAVIDLVNGDIGGVDLEQALRRMEKQPLSIASAIRSGRTSFREAHIDLEAAAGAARIRSFEAKGAGADISVSGSSSIAQRMLDLTIQARQTGREDSQPAPHLSMDLKGNWDDPNLIIDAQSLIRRSEAAAPLLRSLNAPQVEGAASQARP